MNLNYFQREHPVLLTCSGDSSRNSSSQKIPGDIVILRGGHDDITIDIDLGNYFLNIVVDLFQCRLAWKQLQRTKLRVIFGVRCEPVPEKWGMTLHVDASTQSQMK